MRGLPFVLLPVALGCGEDRLSATWPNQIDRAFTVVVPENWNGSPAELEITGPIALDASARTQLEVGSNAGVFVVGLSESRPGAVHPRVTAEGAWQLIAKSPELTGAPGCATEGWFHEDQALEVPFETPSLGARTYELDEDSAELRLTPTPPFSSVLSFRAPLEPCFAGRRLALTPFAEGTGGGFVPSRNYQVQFLDDDRVVVMSPAALLLIRRGSSQEEQVAFEAASLGLPSPSAEAEWVFSALALSVHDDAITGVVALSHVTLLQDFAFETRVFSIELRGTRFALGRELWRDEAAEPESAYGPTHFAIEASGTWVGAGTAIVLTATSPTATPTAFERPRNFDADGVLATGQPEPPFVVSGRSFILTFDPQRGEAGFETLPIPPEASQARLVDALNLDRHEAGVDLHVGFSTPEIGRRSLEGEAWRTSRIWTTEEETRCVQERDCGRPYGTQRPTFLVAGTSQPRTTTFIAPVGCARVYLVDEAASCAISAPFELGPTVGFEGPDNGTLYEAARRGEHTVIVGERGRVLEVRLD